MCDYAQTYEIHLYFILFYFFSHSQLTRKETTKDYCFVLINCETVIRNNQQIRLHIKSHKVDFIETTFRLNDLFKNNFSELFFS